jgi:hypothetical protein
MIAKHTVEGGHDTGFGSGAAGLAQCLWQQGERAVHTRAQAAVDGPDNRVDRSGNRAVGAVGAQRRRDQCERGGGDAFMHPLHRVGDALYRVEDQAGATLDRLQ